LGKGQPIVFSHGWSLSADDWGGQTAFVLHRDDDQIVPYKDAGVLPAKLLKNATLKIYPGSPRRMLTTHADVINADLLAFIKG
jgi:non-heme chloroperoxidase